MLVRLIYASTASEGFGLNESKLILEQSQINNHKRDLTGVLSLNSKIFLQALEGAREQINELYGRLLRDKRHHTVAILDYAEIEEREWSQWSMGFAAASPDNRAVFMKYSGQSIFNPYAMGAGSVKKMLNELAGKSISMSVSTEKVDTAETKNSGSTPLAPRREVPVFRPSVAASAAVNLPTRTTAPDARTLPANTSTSDSGFLGRFLNR